VNVLKDNLKSPAPFTPYNEPVIVTYPPLRPLQQWIDGIFFYYTTFIYHLPAVFTSTTLLFLKPNWVVMSAIIYAFLSIGGVYFLPIGLSYALSHETTMNRWFAIFKFSKVFFFSLHICPTTHTHTYTLCCYLSLEYTYDRQ
jgi:hypothetical protein